MKKSESTNKTNNIFSQIDKIIETSLDQLVSERYARYAKYIIQDRALPDCRDGLKPVQRRILFAMNELGVFSNKSYVKSARIAGEVMGKYHPHGDQSIYDAMVRMSQDFKNYLTLVDMHGNNGSIDGDPAAASRYTEARMSIASEYLLKDIDKKTVPFIPNYDDTLKEPTVLPAKFPNLLVNGAAGISSGYATKIPPHNVGEVIDATIYILETKNPKMEKILELIKGPDFPTGGIIARAGIQACLETGVGKVTLRSKTHLEKINELQERIVVTEIPFDKNKAELVRQIDVLRIEKNLNDIVEIRDESDREGLRVVIDLKPGIDSDIILNYLFKNSDLQVNYNYNMVSILNHRPVTSGVLQMLNAYIKHQIEVITNRSNYELEKCRQRVHIVEGLVKMISVLDEVIKIIRASKNKSDSKDNLIKAFGFSELQAEAIVMLHLYRLSNYDILLLEEEMKNLLKQIANLELILSDETELRKVIKKELLESKSALNKERKTIIVDELEIVKIEDHELISNEIVKFGITKDGYLKRSNIKNYKATTKPTLKEQDFLIYENEHPLLNTILIFTQFGNACLIPIFKIDETKWSDYGVHLGQLVELLPNERIIKYYILKDMNITDTYLLSTNTGQLKRIEFERIKEKQTCKSFKVFSINQNLNEQISSVDNQPEDYIICLAKDGHALRYTYDTIPIYGLNAGGIKGMLVEKGNKLVSAFYISLNDEFVCMTSRGNLVVSSAAMIVEMDRNRKGNKFFDIGKTNPHYIASADRYTFASKANNSKVTIIFEKGIFKENLNDIKLNDNKYGVKIEDKLGVPINISIERNLALKYDNKSVAPKPQKIEVKKKEVTEKKESVVLDESTLPSDPKLRKIILAGMKNKRTKSKPIKKSLFDDEE